MKLIVEILVVGDQKLLIDKCIMKRLFGTHLGIRNRLVALTLNRLILLGQNIVITYRGD